MQNDSIEIQRRLLAAVFENPEIFPALKRIEEEDFDDGQKPYRRVWAAIKQDIVAGKRPTEESLAAKTGLPLQTLQALKQIEYDLNNIDYYVESIIDFAKQRALSQVKRADSLETAEKAIDLARQVSMRLPSMDRCAVGEHIDEYIAAAEVERQTPLEKRIVRTPFADLNEIIGGFFNDDFICVAARPGLGKTAWTECVIEHTLRQGFPVVSFILEMTPRRLIERGASRNLGIPVKDIIMQTIDDGELASLYQYLAKVREYPWTIYSLKDGIGSFSRMRDVFLGLYQEKPFRLATVDYLQLMFYEGSENRTKEVGNIANGLARLSTQVNVPVIGVSQLSRAVETRQDKRPMLSDLRESGEIEQAAATVIFLYRDGYYNPDTEVPNVAEFIVSKSRYGPTGNVDAYWNGERMLFADLQKSTVF